MAEPSSSPKTAKIALIRTPIVQPIHHVTSLRAVPSIGLAYVSAALTAAGHEVFVVDAAGEGLFQFRQIEGTGLTVNGLSATEICQRIPSDVDLIGVSAMHMVEWVYDRYIVEVLRKRFPDVPIILGGENATSMYRMILQDAALKVALVVRGEADHSAPAAVEALLSGHDLENVPGIAYLDRNGEVVLTKSAGNIRELDQLPLPRWEGVPLERYFAAKTGLSSHSERSLTMLATRGCPHSCTFCTVPQMWNSRWAPRSPEAVVEEMEMVHRKYGVTHIDFVDLTFALSGAWTEKFCDILISRNLDLRWSLPIGTRTESLSRELLIKMRRAGCLRILLAPESGSRLTLLRIKKKLNMNDMNGAIEYSLEAGLVVKLATIFGFPGQTKREVLTTLFFILQAALRGVHDVVCLSFVPYPGTELYDQLVSAGKVVPGSTPVRLNNDIKDMTSWSEHIPKWLTRYIVLVGMACFYGIQFTVRPWRVLRAIRNIFILKKPVTNFESIIYCFFFRVIRQISEVERLGSIELTREPLHE